MPYRKGRKGPPLRHQAYPSKAGFQKVPVNAIPICPQQPTPIANLAETDAPMEEMLKDMRENKKNVIVDTGEWDIRIPISPHPDMTAPESIRLNNVNDPVGPPGQTVVKSSMQFDDPGADGHANMLLVHILDIHKFRPGCQ